MKAAVIHEFGPPEVLRIEDAATPQPAAGEVLVRVRAVRVGGLLDIGTRAGRNPFARLTFPHILGADFAGEVVEGGEGFSPGERIAGVPFIPCGHCQACSMGRDDACPNAQLVGVHRQGSYAEYVSVPAKIVRRIPPSIGYEQAAALALSGPVAVTQFGVAGLRKGDWVVVTAAASGLGLVTSLVAQALGARVIACSRKEWKREILRGHGFEAVLNTDDDGFVDQVKELTTGRGVAIAIDNTASTSMFAKLCAVLDRLGVIVCSGALAAETVPLDMRSLYLKSQSVIGIRTHTQASLDGFWRMVQDGIETRIDRSFPLDDVAEAHRYVEAEKNFGRVLLTID
ncbi:MAG: zinc-binding dehydrogenase [Chloroflexi bacterium]|nr:MAG: zinc-binding dehydrogenase [Chloroflexota bacterium]